MTLRTYLQNILSDLRSGKNLDSYLISTIAVAFAVLGLIGLTSINLLISATLAML